MKYIVNTPSKAFEGKRANVHFRKGTTGEVELTEVQVKAFKHLGYEVTEVKPVAKKTTVKKGE